jgi:hypothetical protein
MPIDLAYGGVSSFLGSTRTYARDIQRYQHSNHALLAPVDADTHQYSTKDRPFRIWLAPFEIWVYVLPLKYLPQIKSQGITELSLRSFIDKVRF